MAMTFSENSKKVICFNRIIDVHIYYYSRESKENKEVNILTPRYGLKPDISVNLSVLPSNNVMGMTVTVRNMLTDIDMSKAYYMSVIMGYASCGVAMYHGIVFRSYQATPNPDGEFVFEGIVTGEKIGFSDCPSILDEDPVTLRFNDVGNLPFKDYIEHILNGTEKRKPKFQFEVSITDNVKSKMESLTAVINKQTKAFATPLARAVYARQVITEWSSSNELDIVVVIEGSKFIVTAMDRDDTAVPENAIDIIGYNSASFNGALLNLKMPYYPAIQAGSLIRCDAMYTSQSGLPNDNNNTTQRNTAWSLYRVMRYSVSFSTVRENIMTIDAFPIKEAGRIEVDESDEGVKKQNYNKSYLQMVLEHEYSTKDNEGNIISGDLKIDTDVVNAKKNSSAGSFSSYIWVAYNNLKDVSGVISLMKEQYHGYNVMLKYSSAGFHPAYYSIDCLFPLVYSLTWYKHRSDTLAADSPNEFPLSLTSGNVFFPTIPSIKLNTVAVKSVLSDFIKIFEKYNDNGQYNDYVNTWKKMIDEAVSDIHLFRNM